MGRPPKSDLSPELGEILIHIGSNISDLRIKAGISQAELARRSKISTTTLNEIEVRCFRDIRVSTLAAIASALGVPLQRLFHSTDLDLQSKDKARLLKASEDILQIARKLRKGDD